MFDINEDEVLARVQKYELVRRRGRRRIYIDLYQVIAGRHSAKFMAVPKTRSEPVKMNIGDVATRRSMPSKKACLA